MPEERSRLEVWTPRISHALTLLMKWFGAHWLLLASAALVLYVGLPLLAPWLMHEGHQGAAKAIYLLFRPLCHQLPERSYFLFGPQTIYSYGELYHAVGGDVPLRYVGSTEIGFKMAICQRCVAVYAMFLLGGFAFALGGRRLKPLTLRRFALLISPMAVDGFGQLLGLWSSTWWSRTLTGGLFAIACVWLAYPHIQRGMDEVHQEALRMLREAQN